MAILHLLLDGQDLPTELQGDETVLGRHPECQLQINSNMVSRKHARVFRNGGKFQIEDLGSGNGTFLTARRSKAPPNSSTTIGSNSDRFCCGLRRRNWRQRSLPPPPHVDRWLRLPPPKGRR